ncbi:MAG: prolipoprotein diacylglyceryl transferase, partial [Defluviitaleaceae bacterium]|nr:prolipoprotein diacylglyceryl transferase [Defluviitaleaceae bacterium]
MAPDVIFPHLGITIQNLSRVAFTVFGVNVYWYGITMVLGVILGTLVACVRAKRSGQKYELYLDFLFFAIIGCVICARLYYVAFDWGNFRGDLGSVFSLRQGGLA